MLGQWMFECQEIWSTCFQSKCFWCRCSWSTLEIISKLNSPIKFFVSSAINFRSKFPNKVDVFLELRWRNSLRCSARIIEIYCRSQSTWELSTPSRSEGVHGSDLPKPKVNGIHLLKVKIHGNDLLQAEVLREHLLQKHSLRNRVLRIASFGPLGILVLDPLNSRSAGLRIEMQNK